MTSDFRTPLTTCASEVFRAYDIRGRVPDQINTQTAYWLGRVLADKTIALNRSPICVGADGRLTGPELKQALICGLREGGADVIDSGFVATPVVYFAAHQQEIANAVVLTASHNPADQNGFKILINNQALMDEEISNLASRMRAEDLSTGAGKLIEHDYTPSYVHHLAQTVELSTRPKLVIDTANGIAGPLAQKLFKRLNLDPVCLYSEVDGNFPNHSPDPCRPANLEVLRNRVLKDKADLGIALDGDGDRVVLVDQRGEVIAADDLLMLFTQSLADDQPNAKLIYDVKCSSRVSALAEKLGIEAILSRTGHSPMKRLMQQSGAQLGGELSAHYYFADWYGFDDGLYAALQMLQIIEQQKQSATTLVAALPKIVSTPELRIEVKDSTKFDLIEQLKSCSMGEINRSEIDGLRYEFPQGWGVVRASNTEGALVVRFEAENRELLNDLYQHFQTNMNSIDASLTFPELASDNEQGA